MWQTTISPRELVIIRHVDIGIGGHGGHVTHRSWIHEVHTRVCRWRKGRRKLVSVMGRWWWILVETFSTGHSFGINSWTNKDDLFVFWVPERRIPFPRDFAPFFSFLCCLYSLFLIYAEDLFVSPRLLLTFCSVAINARALRFLTSHSYLTPTYSVTLF